MAVTLASAGGSTGVAIETTTPPGRIRIGQIASYDLDAVRQPGRCGIAGQRTYPGSRRRQQVAHRIGYTSEFAFANAFKREYGTAPGRYRRHKGARPPVMRR
ncbi:helix-turn-helix domain-containing protein [Streptomyces sp. NPDC052236]|uniref:helix-turn-helix domain-containing protein n=1 Tax=Streptomyces sp. NPDC052236 TaxID=3365686 RepID=UPI0037D33074